MTHYVKHGMTGLPQHSLPSMDVVTVALGPRSYPIRLVTDGAAEFAAFVRGLLPRTVTALVVADENTAPLGRELAAALSAGGLRTHAVVVPAGEDSKSLTQLERIYETLCDLAADRQTVVVAVGGGVVGDLAGFAAATYNRGLPLIMVPTSLLAMVDSSVGGKTAINLPRGKNLVGAFHQPRGVWIDTAYLRSLPIREFRSGFAEIVKYGVILDPALFQELEEHAAELLAAEASRLRPVIARCCRLKADIVEQDEREESGLRAILNYGHTFGHAFETVGKSDRWLHGEAVAAGMMCAAQLAARVGVLEQADLPSRQQRLVERFGLPVRPLPHWPIEELIATMRRDKKALAGRLRLILPRRIGQVELIEDVPEPVVRQVLEEMMAQPPGPGS